MAYININIKILKIILFITSLQMTVYGTSAWGDDSVLLSDIKVLTLHHGKMTTARRSNPVPHLKCIGGTAGCSKFVPQVVQCINQGSDGNEVQWECKTDMDNAYRFGKVEVSCEGYNYAGDMYVLKGSCGLEYTIDLTKEGHQSSQGHSYYGQQGSYNYESEKPSAIGNLILLVIVGLIIFAIYKTCITTDQYSPGNDDYPGSDHRHGSGFGGGSFGPPPPGFRPEYNPGGGCSAGAGTSNMGTGTGGGGGFWSGAATGGILGYLLGSNNRGQTYQRPSYGGGLFGGGGSSSYGFRSGGGSTGSRSASGFGGTRSR